jgi:hypothetical protein
MLKSPLVGDVLTKASQHALRKVFNIHDRYLPSGPGKEEIPLLCSGNTKRTMGIPCIHIIKECVDMQQPLSLDQFHYRHEDLPPVNLRMIVLEPRVVSLKKYEEDLPSPPPPCSLYSSLWYSLVA